jgi:hypothetical protein
MRCCSKRGLGVVLLPAPAAGMPLLLLLFGGSGQTAPNEESYALLSPVFYFECAAACCVRGLLLMLHSKVAALLPAGLVVDKSPRDSRDLLSSLSLCSFTRCSLSDVPLSPTFGQATALIYLPLVYH